MNEQEAYMLRLVVIAIITFMVAPLTFAQAPPQPPPGDFPSPYPSEGNKKPGKKNKEMVQPERSGVKPPMPIMPPSPVPTIPDTK